MFYREEKLAIFIDGVNTYAATRELDFTIDFKRLRTEFSRRGRLQRIYYYTPLQDEAEYSPLRPLIDWLRYNGYFVVTKPGRKYIDNSGRERSGENMDIELTVQAMETASMVDHIVLFSGNGNFKPLVESLQRKGVRVSVVSTLCTEPSMVSDGLRRQADAFIELDELKSLIAKSPKRSVVLTDSA